MPLACIPEQRPGVDEESAEQMVRCVVNFMIQEGFVSGKGDPGYCSQVIADTDLVPVVPTQQGFFRVVSGQDRGSSKDSRLLL